ncbi:aminoglycoside phosphotransferase family protein [Lederbergia wuyishanensis]|uniref:Ser/Thr protein kinase RdoA (MazF antagonist) n=1 Tax=Lederbergia wuyishanensis TaxID=1347903 RepID=A0ABU0D0I6_9BACI|nr:aminoglycoside phosphotransferase family protein [Lederbergia wuyishanensis]MCJ8006526.1 aminoglycoside phosphotransferase family protein [Lederbergia wuyishanensis]MDQ0341903.1 Ser/Thr protein kinase RdoA (MazF antagonist) [Lederbergia wuyishanensis]
MVEEVEKGGSWTEINNRIEAILREYYDIEATRIEQRTGGWSALAFLIEGKNMKYFLKVYNKHKPSVIQWIDAIDRYIPLVKWIYDQTELNSNIVSPISTKFDVNKCEDECFLYLLSEYVQGTTIGENPLNHSQVNDLARILGLLHSYTSIIPNELIEQQKVESFDIEYCDSLSSFILQDLDKKHDVVLEILNPYTSCLLDKIERMNYLSNTLKHKALKYVLCHADAHNWNIMQAENLMLIDWECVKMAPQEQDLILIVTEPYAQQFLKEYRKHMNYAKIDIDAFEFYFLKRKLEDIWEWIKDLRYEGLVKSEDITLKLLRTTLKECSRADRFRLDLEKLI